MRDLVCVEEPCPESENPCHPTQTCEMREGAPFCLCKDGLLPRYSWQAPEGFPGTCICQLGYRLTWINNQTEIECIDLNECLFPGARYGHHCHESQVCENTVGSYTCNCTANMELEFDFEEEQEKCVCKEGFESFNATECIDKDECLNPIEDDYNKCHETQLCENSIGSFNCYCSESMEPQSGHDSCKCKQWHEPIEDVPNECKILLDPCAAGEYRIEGSTICRPCEYGHYCEQDAKFPCERGFFADKSGSTICTYCGAGATTINIGSTRRRDCIIGSYGFFSPLFNEEPIACQFQSFCPKGLREMTPFYHNHKGANICLKSETKNAVGKMKLRKAPVPPVYDAEPENFCYRVCRGKPNCVAFSILLEDKIFCVLISS